MVRLGIPFIVPGSQVFLPPLLVDLRERQPVAIKRSRGKMLTPAAQCLVLFHLQRESLSKKPLQEIAKLIGYSPIMVTMVKRELESAGICEALKQGRSVTLSFLHDRRELWDRVEPLLSSPCRRNWVKWAKPDPTALLAGMSALSHLTMISDDPLPTYALGRKIFRAHNEQGDFHVCHERDEANACLESWSYDPRILFRSAIVDTLSLYLSLRGSADERVQQQLETLIREFPW
jgi:DNA-binding MarR family transcriptional regulator